MHARRTLPALALALATLSLTTAARAQQPAPAAAPQPGSPDNTLLAPLRIEGPALAPPGPDPALWEARAASMHTTLQLLEQGERDAQTASLALLLGMGAGSTLTGGVALGVNTDPIAQITGGVFLGAGAGMLLGAPLGYLFWTARRPQQSLLVEYQTAVRAQMPTELRVRTLEGRWELRANEQRGARILAAVTSGIAGAASVGLGLYFVVSSSSFSGGGASTITPLAVLIGALGAASLGSSIWIGLTPTPTERSLEHWRAFGAPAPARALSVTALQPTALLTPEVRGVALTGVFF